MVPHSQNVAYSDGGSEVLWEDGERAFRRGWRLDDDGKRRAVLLVAPAADHPSRSNLDRLTHEYELKDELDGAWAVRPLELVRDAGRTMLVLEDADGELLDPSLGAPMELGRFLRLAIAVASALGKLHQRRLVHKDIKPANILFNEATGEVRLTGFGIASRFARERQSPHPPEMIAGTLAYMAPEQTGRMNRSIDSRSDLYALGVTFYQMLTGALPFIAAEPMEWVHCHLARRPVPPAERLKEIPDAVSAIVMKLLAKRAEDRYQTAAGLESDLRSCLIEWQAQGRIDDFPLGEHDTSDRLLIPEKLYGRRREVETLLASFDRVVNGGGPELVLVSGYSGIGKSSVVNELQPLLVAPRGLFASGKFDQLKRDIPCATLAQALQSLIRPLLGKSDADLAPWRDALQETLGSNAGLMVDLVPELRVLIGEPLPVPELPPQDAQRRFQMVLRQLIGIFARPEHPLALFLDDLQWLDAATLDLLEDLLSRSDLRNLLLIGAFRDNEVTAAHPLMRKLEAIRATGRVQDIKLAPLTINDLGNLVADTLRCDAEQADPLATLVNAKTDGNPFFVIQFLHVLADERLLAFDHERGRWSWDMRGIHAKRYTDNVVELLAEKLRRLPPNTQDALRQLACLGSVADVAILSVVLEMSEEQVHAAFWEALREPVVDRLERSYKFVHDQVQEAAYALVPEESRAEAHLRIGRLLATHTPTEKRDEAIFEIVNQLNRGAPLITSRDEREQLAELNLIAGRRAKASTAYVSALAYLRTGTALLADDCWERRYELTFALELNQAECEFLTANLRDAESRFADLARRGVSLPDLAAVAQLRGELITTLGRFGDAVDVALDYMSRVGVTWSAHPTAADVRQEYGRMWRQVAERPIEALLDLPRMTDPVACATMNVLTSVIALARYTDENLRCLVIGRMINLSLEHGNCDASCLAYAAVGTVLGAHFGDYEAAHRFGKLGLDLVEQGGLSRFKARVYVFFASLVIPWTRHVRTGRQLLRHAFDTAQQTGDFTYSAYSRQHLVTHLLASGDALADVQLEAEASLEFAHQARNGIVIDIIAAQLQLIRTLRGLTPIFGSFDDEQFDELQMEHRFFSNPGLAFAECLYCVRKLQARVLAGQRPAAIAAAAQAQRLPWLASPHALFEVAEYHFYASLARAALWDVASAAERADHREALVAHQHQLQVWAQNCPPNFEDRAALVGAEIARIEGRTVEAMELYERAVASARANGFVHNEALAYELAARFYAARGFEEVAHFYLRNARQCYLRWGADGKVRQLDQLHPRLRQDERAPGATRTIEAPVENLDLATVIELSQALSGEIVLEKLIDRLMRVAIEHAGAERGLLIRAQGEELQIDAEATARGEDMAVHVRQSGTGTEVALPEPVIRYAIRTQEIVILDDASSPNLFSADPYIVEHRVRSILCLPLISQGKFNGILYLENNLAPHVFTSDRVTVLKMLASQAAISLENSRLYRDLEDREGKIRRLVDANIIGVLVADHDGRVLEANDALLHIVGYDREDLISGRLSRAGLTPAEWHERDIRTITELNSTGTVQPFEKEYLRKNGSRVPVLIGGARFREGGNETDVAFVLDLSERKRAEEALRKLESDFAHMNRVSMMGELAASLSHEITQPIASARNNARAAQNFLERQPPNLGEIREALACVVGDADRARDIIDRIREQMKKTPPRKERFDLNAAINEVIVLAQSVTVRNGVSVQTRLVEGLLPVLGDRIQLQQVLLNLILNAAEAMSLVEEGARELLISTDQDQTGALVTVRDSGPGIDPGYLDRVFDAFYTTKSSGTGMGLSICRSIIHAHGGKLWAGANEPRGAAFQFTLPDAERELTNPLGAGQRT